MAALGSTGTTTATTTTTSTLPTLPTGVLTEHVFPFVGVRSLARAAQVCREWREAADEDVLWKAACARRWAGKLNVPPVVASASTSTSTSTAATTSGKRAKLNGSGEPATLFAFAKFTPDMSLSLKDLREILAQRRVDTRAFLEKKEFMDAVVATNPRRFGGWDATHRGKWKASYVYSVHLVRVHAVTRAEIVDSTWIMSFRNPEQFGSISTISRFSPDGMYLSNPAFQTNLQWVPVDAPADHPLEEPGRHVGLCIAKYPPLTFSRRPDFSLELVNAFVQFRQIATGGEEEACMQDLILSLIHI